MEKSFELDAGRLHIHVIRDMSTGFNPSAFVSVMKSIFGEKAVISIIVVYCLVVIRYAFTFV